VSESSDSEDDEPHPLAALAQAQMKTPAQRAQEEEARRRKAQQFRAQLLADRQGGGSGPAGSGSGSTVSHTWSQGGSLGMQLEEEGTGVVVKKVLDPQAAPGSLEGMLVHQIGNATVRDWEHCDQLLRGARRPLTIVFKAKAAKNTQSVETGSAAMKGSIGGKTAKTRQAWEDYDEEWLEVPERPATTLNSRSPTRSPPEPKGSRPATHSKDYHAYLLQQTYQADTVTRNLHSPDPER